MAAFGQTLLALKIYRTRYVHYRFFSANSVCPNAANEVVVSVAILPIVVRNIRCFFLWLVDRNNTAISLGLFFIPALSELVHTVQV